MKYGSNSSVAIDHWIIRPRLNSQARIRLFCFPFAGGGASFYRSWVNYLPPEIELCAVQIPGRENRLREPLFTKLRLLVDTLSPIIAEYINNIPFVFFGHSMGAWIGYEVIRELRRKGEFGPSYLFVSGRRAPHLAAIEPPKHNLSEAKFIDEIRRYNGTPELIMREPELMEIFLPVLRADFSIVETYEYENLGPVDCPITAFGGLQDNSVTLNDLESWRIHTSSEFRAKTFAGGHFYLKDLGPQLLSEIKRDISRVFPI
jgi:medium-chain acyl-[acyl-carrier-protein] hydrolase